MSPLARQLRRTVTAPERLVWKRLRNRQLAGIKFRRQHPIGPYVVDFVCLERELVIELDGKQHQRQKFYDDERTRMLEACGFVILRYRNIDIYTRLKDVIAEIEAAVAGVTMRKRGTCISTPSPPVCGGREVG